MEAVSLADRPDVAADAFAIPYGDGPGGFMQSELVSKLVRRTRIIDRWPSTTVALLEGGECVARGVAVTFASGLPGREPFPDRGWDQIVVWAVEDALDGQDVDAVCALEIAVHPAWQRRGLSAQVLAAMRANAAGLGFSELIAPVRPPDKAAEPWTAMAEYATRKRGDGLPADSWLRVHARAGGRIVRIAPCSATIQASLDEWRGWTGVALEEDGPVAVPGALVPILVARQLGVGVYVEPNVWMVHPLESDDRA